MTPHLSPELWYTALTALLTSVIWIPYSVARILENGLWFSLRNPELDPGPKAQWGYRMVNAHRNAVENLAVFAALAIVVHLMELSNATTAMAAAIFFGSRVAHLIIYTLGIPILRTLSFFVGFLCQITLALRILGYL